MAIPAENHDVLRNALIERIGNIRDGHPRFVSREEDIPSEKVISMAIDFIRRASEEDLEGWCVFSSTIRPALVFNRTNVVSRSHYEDVTVILEDDKIHFMITSYDGVYQRSFEVDLSADEPHRVMSERSEMYPLDIPSNNVTTIV